MCKTNDIEILAFNSMFIEEKEESLNKNAQDIKPNLAE